MPFEVTVKYFAPFKSNAGLEEETIELEEGSRLKDLIRLVREQHGMEELTMSKALITINEKGASQLSGLETELRRGDRVCFMPFISGG